MHEDIPPSPYQFILGYITMPYELQHPLPSEITAGGKRFIIKPNFHISLVAVKELVLLTCDKHGWTPEEAEVNITAIAAKQLMNQPVTFLGNCGRLFSVQKADSEGNTRSTIVGQVKVSGLEELHANLRDQLNTPEFPVQPPHVTLYVWDGNPKPIGITSQEEWSKITQPLNLDIKGCWK